MDKYNEEIERLESEELWVTNETTNFYHKLFAYYLVQNNMYGAKFFWKRIPTQLKDTNKEIGLLYKLLEELYSNNISEVFSIILHNDWSDDIKIVIADLLKVRRKQMLDLIGKAYTSVYEECINKLINMNQDQLVETCASLDWSYERAGNTNIIFPKRSDPSMQSTTTSEQQLLKLTDFVSFLEN